MTKTELRVLQILANNTGRQKRLEISQQMSRYTAEERNQALASLETLELVNSAEVPCVQRARAGGVAGLVYWLTPAGLAHVEQLRTEGRIVEKIVRKSKDEEIAPTATARVPRKAKATKPKKRRAG